jgi:hypothetical protein
MNRHWIMRFVIVFSAILTISVGQTWAVEYVAIDLNYLGYGNTIAYGTCDGQQVGSGHYGNNTYNHALLWSGSAASVVDLGPNLSLVSSVATGACGGQQVGYAYSGWSDVNTHAYLWTGSIASAIDLNPIDWNASYALGTNGVQQVGYGSSSSFVNQHAVLWSGTAESAVDLNPSGFNGSKACGISGGQQVGYGEGIGYDHALLWSGTAASVVDLNPEGFNSSQALSVSGGQQAGYGLLETGNNPVHALLWNGSAASAVDLNPSGFDNSIANGISNGQQVGAGYVSGTGGSAYAHALLWGSSADSFVDLHQFLPSGWASSFAESIDAQGNIVGYAVDSQNLRRHAFLWQPVPEPGTFVMLGLGAFSLLFIRRRKRAG